MSLKNLIFEAKSFDMLNAMMRVGHVEQKRRGEEYYGNYECVGIWRLVDAGVGRLREAQDCGLGMGK